MRRAILDWLAVLAELAGVAFVIATLLFLAIGFAPDLPQP